MNLVYGIYLEEIINRGVAINILFLKAPSHIHKVKYKKANDELYKTDANDFNKTFFKHIYLNMFNNEH